MRQILSGCGATSLTFATLQDVHRTTIPKKETLLRRARLASHRCWYHDMLARLYRWRKGVWKWSIHMIRGDATNAQVWQRSKLHSTELDTTW